LELPEDGRGQRDERTDKGAEFHRAEKFGEGMALKI